MMREWEVPLDESWDVMVVGGGPSGCTAAAAAAREGAKTLLIEAGGMLGGMGTAGLVPAWCPFTDGEKIIYRGLAERVLKETMAGMPQLPPNRFDWTPIDAERLKRVYDNLVTGAGASVLFHTVLAGVEANDGWVNTALTASKAGLVAYRAKMYVDCTGDGDLCAWAGAPFEKGDPVDGDLQPATHCFTLSNVDEDGFHHRGSFGGQDGALAKMLSSGRYTDIPDHHACNNLVGPGTVGFNSGHLWKVDNTDPASTSRALMAGRKMAEEYRRGLAEFFPQAFGNAFLVATGSMMGIRESRRIIGDYVLTLDDFMARRGFEDEIARNCYFIDIHHKEKDVGTERECRHTIRYGKGESHGIPYRCLTAHGFRNVLVAGRCISTDRTVQGSTRVMPVCLTTGEAAGVAAAQTLSSRTYDVHRIEVSRLRARLREVGAYLP